MAGFYLVGVSCCGEEECVISGHMASIFGLLAFYSAEHFHFECYGGSVIGVLMSICVLGSIALWLYSHRSF